MRIVCVFILWVCCVRLGMSNECGSRGEMLRWYEELQLSDVVGLPAFEQAWKDFGKYRQEKESLVTLIDFTRPSTEQRFCVVDLEKREVLFRSHVAHGRNSGGNYAVSFSNRPGSYQSSLGWYRTGGTYYGRNGYSLLLDGLEAGINDKARERAIVMHGAAYADPGVLRGQEWLGRSLGCPALPPAISKKIIDTIKNGTLLYIYGENKGIGNLLGFNS